MNKKINISMTKRTFDLIIILIISPFIFLIFLFISFIIFIFDGTPIIFKQSRSGYKGATFNIYKFKTMMTDNGKNLTDNERVTKLGKFLRKTSIDEIPNIYNVIVGNLSLVGPRPLLPEYLELYDKDQKKRLDVKPGITGWAQINGRNGISWEEKFNLDVWYVKNNTLLLDIKIIFKTIFKVLSQDGISSSDEFSMPKFKGSKK